jgi:hypothetical protein
MYAVRFVPSSRDVGSVNFSSDVRGKVASTSL